MYSGIVLISLYLFYRSEVGLLASLLTNIAKKLYSKMLILKDVLYKRSSAFMFSKNKKLIFANITPHPTDWTKIKFLAEDSIISILNEYFKKELDKPKKIDNFLEF